MTLDIIVLAKEAGFNLFPTANMLYTVRGNHAQLERFADLIIERCAIRCEENAERWPGQLEKTYAAHECAAAIRALKVGK